MQRQNPKTAVVTGGAGFIGSHLCRGLNDAGYAVRAVDILDLQVSAKSLARAEELKTDGILASCNLVRGDIRNTALMQELFEGADVVFHTAALPRVQYSIENPQETFSVNVAGTLSVLSAAVGAGVRRVIFSSSSSVYGDQGTLPLSERLQPDPQSPYALHKWHGEHYCRLYADLYDLETVSLRYFNVYGPGFDPDGPYALVIGKFLRQRKEGEQMTITGDGEQTRDFTHVDDVVRANIQAAQKDGVGTGAVFNIGAGSAATINYIAELIGGPTTFIPPRLEPRHTLADATLAKHALEWEPKISLEGGIASLKKIEGVS